MHFPFLLRIVFCCFLLNTGVAGAQPQPSFEIGLDFLSRRMYRQSDSLFTRLINIEKDNDLLSMAYRYRGLSRIGIKQFVNAIDDFSKAIVLDSDDLSLYLERGKAYIQIHKFDEAKADFEEVYKKDKNGEDGQLALGYLGDLALNEGEYIQSVEYFSMYCKNEPNNGRGYYMMGMSIIKYLESDEGRVDKKFKYTIKDACDHLNKAVSLGYTFAKEWQVEYCK